MRSNTNAPAAGSDAGREDERKAQSTVARPAATPVPPSNLAGDRICCPWCGGTVTFTELRHQLEPAPGAKWDSEVSGLLDLVDQREREREG